MEEWFVQVSWNKPFDPPNINSGTPIDKAPFHDIPEIAKDPNQVNDFQYTSRYPDSIQDQTRCPFSAHLRKTNPRGDVHRNGLEPDDEEKLAIRRIIRQGITFGPEVTEEEKKNKKSSTSPKLERGLLFVAYQSSISNGFSFIQQRQFTLTSPFFMPDQFLQTVWANNPGFPFEKKGFSDQKLIGLDPLIGQERPDDTPLTRVATGLNPDEPTKPFIFPEFVTTRGGEYFFSPSIPALKDIFSNQGNNE
jgi:deferrochelatase/peroxidase EfeB